MKRALLCELQALRAAGEAVALVTRLSDGAQSLVTVRGCSGALAPEPGWLEQTRQLIGNDRSSTIEPDLFVRVYQRPPRLIVIGAVHIAQALVRMAAEAGLDCTVVDPRAAFASPDRFPGVRVCGDWPDRALAQLAPDARTAIVTLTHDPKLDEPGLRAAVGGPAFYIGALGSRRTHAARLERLRALGVPDAALARIHSPVGLPLGGRRPAEIAVAILAEIIRELYQPARQIPV